MITGDLVTTFVDDKATRVDDVVYVQMLYDGNLFIVVFVFVFVLFCDSCFDEQ